MSAIRALLVVAIVLLASACSPDGDSLFGKVWEWKHFTEQSVDGQGVSPNPGDYTIEFKSDGTFAAMADCHQVNGSYTRADGGAMTLTPDSSTETACDEEALDQLFLSELSATVSHTTADGQLTLTQDDGGTMTFD